MTVYEICRLAALSVSGELEWAVRGELKKLLRASPAKPRILDVGARSSPYTIGLKAKITLLDLPRESALQHQLHLGFTDELLARLQRRRSNVEKIVFEDMTECSLPSDSFDGIVSVETIEHVDDGEAFVSQIARVLKPLGWLTLTTPNGDYIPNTNPDHRRHFTRAELKALLERDFGAVRVVYGIRTGKLHLQSIMSPDIRRPLRTARIVIASFANRWQSRRVEDQPRRTAHLFATAWKT